MSNNNNRHLSSHRPGDLIEEISFPSIAVENTATSGNPIVESTPNSSGVIKPSTSSTFSNNNNNRNNNNNNNNTGFLLAAGGNNEGGGLSREPSRVLAAPNQNTFPRTASSLTAVTSRGEHDDEPGDHNNDLSPSTSQSVAPIVTNLLMTTAIDKEDDMQHALSRHTSALLGAMGLQQPQSIPTNRTSAGNTSNNRLGGLVAAPSGVFSDIGSFGGSTGGSPPGKNTNHNHNNTTGSSLSRSPSTIHRKNSMSNFTDVDGNLSASPTTGKLKRTHSTVTVTEHVPGSDSSPNTNIDSGDGSSSPQNNADQSGIASSNMLLEQDRFEAMRRREKVFRVLIDGDDGGFHMKQVFKRICDACRLRERYTKISRFEGVNTGPPTSNIRWTKQSKLAFNKNTGMMHFSDLHLPNVPSWRDFASDLESVLLTTENSMCSKACGQRLEIMQERSKMINLLNRELEAPQQPAREGGVFAEVTKVDNSIRFFRCWNAQDGLECIVDQISDRSANGDIVGQDAKGKNVTIGEVFARFGVDNPAGLTPDRLGWQGRPVRRQPAGATEPIFNPLLPVARPLTMLLHQLDSKLFQKVLKRRVRSIEQSYLGDEGLSGNGGPGNDMKSDPGGDGSKDSSSFQSNSQAAEIRIPFYGIIPDEMARLARTMKVNEFGNNRRIAWFLELDLFDYPVCMPAAYGSTGLLEPPDPAKGTSRSRRDSFLQFLECLFLPLVSATLAPEERSNSSLCWFLEQVGGFVFTSREGRARPSIHSNFIHPSQVFLGGDNVNKFNEAYFEYFIWSNLQLVNLMRLKRGLNTFQYRRSTAGGDVTSLISGYLLADVVTNCGAIIHRYPVLQYLLGMNVVPITVSPIYDNAHGLPMQHHPLPALLHRCLKIALASEEPLHAHHDQYPINEEYATSQKCFRLSALDITQMMRNSVLMSSFSDATKKAWLGDGWEDGPGQLSQVSVFRFEFRTDVWKHEKAIMSDLIAQNLGEGFNYFNTSKLSGNNNTSQLIGRIEGITGDDQDKNKSDADKKGDNHAGGSNNNNDKNKDGTNKDGTNNASSSTGGDKNNNNNNNNGNNNNTGGNNNVDGNNNKNNQNNNNQNNNNNNNNNGSSSQNNQNNNNNNNVNSSSMNDASKNPSHAVLSSRQYAAAQAQLSRVTDIEYFAVTDKRVNFPRTVIVGPGTTSDTLARSASELIYQALTMRRRYIEKPLLPWQRKNISAEEAFRKKTATFDEEQYHYVAKDSIFLSYQKGDVHSWPSKLATLDSFHRDYYALKAITDNEDLRKFAFDRLDMLEHKFRLHLATNHAIESGASETGGSMGNRDFYHCSKVDTHIHMAAGMTARMLKDFILDKVTRSADDVVDKDPKTGHVMTFGAFAKKFKITKNLTVDQLNVLADHTLFERFDNFNNHYNPMGLQELRGLLLKTDNFMNGRYFAEIIQKTFDDYSTDQYCFAENRLSIYGNTTAEWGKLADWFDTFGMSSNFNKWMIQLPRLYAIARMLNKVTSFGQYIENIFQPLWEASLHPSKYPRLHSFLNHVSGFDSVDNEARIDQPFSSVPPWQWTRQENPPYPYYCYHLYANLKTLNDFRSMRGLSTFTFRPHCGESGAAEHLVACFLTADLINHGINLKLNTALQYLYYLGQVGLDVSPLSNNGLFLYFLQNPFPKFFRQGLHVALSTDDPLMFHQTNEPLIEEYSIAAKVWDFSPNDMCEIARNSCIHSGFTHDWKMRKLGSRYYLSSSLGNDPNLTHLSDVRVAYRFETYHSEIAFLEKHLNYGVNKKKQQYILPRAMYTTEEENRVIEKETVAHEQVLFSTLDQEMEVLQRDMDSKRESMRSIKAHLGTLRGKNRALIDSLTDVGLKNNLEEKRQQEELDRLAVLKERQRKLDFLRNMGVNKSNNMQAASASSSSPTQSPLMANRHQSTFGSVRFNPPSLLIDSDDQQDNNNGNHPQLFASLNGVAPPPLAPPADPNKITATNVLHQVMSRQPHPATEPLGSSSSSKAANNNNNNNATGSGSGNDMMKNEDSSKELAAQKSILQRSGSLRVSDILQMQQKKDDADNNARNNNKGKGGGSTSQLNNKDPSQMTTADELVSFSYLLEQEQQQEEYQNQEQQKRRLMLMSPRMPPKPKPPMHTLHVGRPVPQAPTPVIQQHHNNNNRAQTANSSVSTRTNRTLFDGHQSSLLSRGEDAAAPPPPQPPKRKENGVDVDDDEGDDEEIIDDDQLHSGNRQKLRTDKAVSKNINSSLGMLKHLAKGTGTVPKMEIASSLYDDGE